MFTFLRQIFFNVAFYGFTALTCIVLTPLLFLKRSQFMALLKFYFEIVHKIEKYILGLDFEIRGQEHLPASGSFLVGAKHYSAYETLKLHLLFHDPAIILKKELLSIPLWGWHTRKSDMIAIDRSSREQSVSSIVEGAKRMQAQGRPIVIFPQGTRVDIDETVQRRPYKGGIIKMYEATGLPIIPLAMNSGLYWPRNAFFKKPGKVIFEFLPAIPSGLESSQALKLLQETVENASQKLIQEAQAKVVINASEKIQ